MKYLFILMIFISFKSLSQQAENTDSTEVRAVVDQLFQGMREGDSTKVANSFHENIRMITTWNDKEGNPMAHTGSADDFKKAVGSPHNELWDERISNVVIQIDDNLAQVWMDYAFYLDDNLNHCGVNAMQLLRNKEGWKMIQLTDTRRKNCD